MGSISAPAPDGPMHSDGRASSIRFHLHLRTASDTRFLITAGGSECKFKMAPVCVTSVVASETFQSIRAAVANKAPAGPFTLAHGLSVSLRLALAPSSEPCSSGTSVQLYQMAFAQLSMGPI